LRGFSLRIHVFTPEMEQYLYTELFPEVTRGNAEPGAGRDQRAIPDPSSI
jgi:hypothetical protein